MGPRLPPELGYGPPLFQSGGQGNLSELPNLREVPNFPGAPRRIVNINGEHIHMSDDDDGHIWLDTKIGRLLKKPNEAINSEPYLMNDINMSLAPTMEGPHDFNPDFIGRLGLTGIQAALIAGGALTAFILPGILGGGGKTRDIAFMAGIGAMAAGGIWAVSNYMKVSAPPTAKSAFITPGLLQNTQVHTQKYSNPVNNLQDVKPINRFDLQTNYVMNKPDDSFDSRINDLILKEAKSMGFGTAGNYPVKMEPWKVKTLIPTTQVEPARDFNTVKMIG